MRVIDQWNDPGGFVHRLREHEDGGLDVQYLDGSWQNIGDRAALYRLKEVLGERSSGAETERRLLRKALEARVRGFESQGNRLIQVEVFRAALDDIFGREKEPTA